MQVAVYIEYNPSLDNPRRHDPALQLIDDMALNVSFIGISPSSQAYSQPQLQPEWSVLKPALELAIEMCAQVREKLACWAIAALIAEGLSSELALCVWQWCD